MTQTIDQNERPSDHPGYCSCSDCTRWRDTRTEVPAPLPTPREQVPASSWRENYMPAILGGLAAVIVGLLMPWLTLSAVFIGQIDRNGFDTSDGKFIAIAAVLIALVASADVQQPSTTRNILMLVGAFAVLVVVMVDYNDLSRRLVDMNADRYGHADIGVGLYMAGLGAVVTLVGAWGRLQSSRGK